MPSTSGIQSTRRRWSALPAAAEYCGVSQKTLRRRIADGSLTAYRIGPRLLRVDLNELDATLSPVPTLRGAPPGAGSARTTGGSTSPEQEAADPARAVAGAA